MGRLVLEVASPSLEQLAADVAVAGVFADERPLRGGAGVADWRLCGWLSELAAAGRLSGAEGERVLLSSRGPLRTPCLLLLGLGARAGYRAATLRQATQRAVAQVRALGAGSTVLALPGLGEGMPPEDAAAAVVGGAVEALAGDAGELLVRLTAPPGRVRLLASAFERAARARPAAVVRMQAEPRPASRGARPTPPAPGART